MTGLPDGLTERLNPSYFLPFVREACPSVRLEL
jgi:hypothetical protein